MKAFARFLATLGPVGYAPIAPATAGSAVVTAVAWFIPITPWPWMVAALVVTTAIAIVCAGIGEETLGHDAHPIVIDELVGQWIALLFVPKTILAYFAAFFLFRVFDVWKPLGAREAQALPGGFGVVTDDVIAGATACGAFHFGAFAVHALMGPRG
jgi:phosphatidylglycerophosphatase A